MDDPIRVGRIIQGKKLYVNNNCKYSSVFLLILNLDKSILISPAMIQEYFCLEIIASVFSKPNMYQVNDSDAYIYHQLYTSSDPY